jgi:hypothetical protein
MSNKALNDTIEEIRKRWKDMPKDKFCEDWMHGCIRHGVRNEDFCNREDDNHYDKVKHPDKYDGNVLSYAPKDINDLLSIIDALITQLKTDDR